MSSVSPPAYTQSADFQVTDENCRSTNGSGSRRRANDGSILGGNRHRDEPSPDAVPKRAPALRSCRRAAAICATRIVIDAHKRGNDEKTCPDRNDYGSSVVGGAHTRRCVGRLRPLSTSRRQWLLLSRWRLGAWRCGWRIWLGLASSIWLASGLGLGLASPLVTSGCRPQSSDCCISTSAAVFPGMSD